MPGYSCHTVAADARPAGESQPNRVPALRRSHPSSFPVLLSHLSRRGVTALPWPPGQRLGLGDTEIPFVCRWLVTLTLQVALSPSNVLSSSVSAKIFCHFI